jgi:thiamine-phosphate pyrophosphorylase
MEINAFKGYYFKTDTAISRAGNSSDVKNALAARVGVVQYREKHRCTKYMFEQAAILRKLCKDIIFLVNDRVDIALGVNADGVHLGKDDLTYPVARRLLGKTKIIGLTVHTLKQAKDAQRLGADYLGVGPVFSTGTKPNAVRPVGIELIKRIKKEVSIPVIAIGGINLTNAPRVISSGADGLCAISAVVTKADAGEEMKRFQELFRREKGLAKLKK